MGIFLRTDSVFEALRVSFLTKEALTLSVLALSHPHTLAKSKIDLLVLFPSVRREELKCFQSCILISEGSPPRSRSGLEP